MRAQGHRVIGIDRADADINADLARPAGREAALAEVHALTDALDAVIASAGISSPVAATVAPGGGGFLDGDPAAELPRTRRGVPRGG